MAAEAQAAEHASQGPTAGEYIQHHLQHLRSHEQTNIIDFSVINFDTLFWSIAMGALAVWLLYRAARRATSGVPGRFQAAIEIVLEMVDNQAKSIVHNAHSRRFVGPLALTVFIWVFLMNSMDFLPVDFIPSVWQWLFGVAGHDQHHAYMRVVPTADLSGTLGLSIGVLCVVLYYNVKIKGLGGFVHELFAAPFGDKWFLYPFNFLMQMIEFLARTVSHGMRLFGNMYAGELLFMLIALMGAALIPWSATGVVLWLAHVVAGTSWAIFHILIVALQAFIFMMLTLVYIGQAHDKH